MKTIVKNSSFLFLLVLSACSVGRSANLADSIEITYETGPEIRATEGLEFWIKNTSSNCMVFPYDFGIKIFTEHYGTITEIPNITQYPVVQDIYLREANDIFSERSVMLRPNLENVDIQGPTYFTARITGQLCNDESIIVEKKIPFVVIP